MYLGHRTYNPTKDGRTIACAESRGRREATETDALQGPRAMVRAALPKPQFPCGEAISRVIQWL